MNLQNSTFSLRIRICGERPFFGPGIYQILKLVDETGSLLNATERAGISYSKALKRIKTAEKEIGEPLLERHVGGVGGGSSTPTPACYELIERYEGFQKELNAAAESLFLRYFRNPS